MARNAWFSVLFFPENYLNWWNCNCMKLFAWKCKLLWILWHFLDFSLISVIAKYWTDCLKELFNLDVLACLSTSVFNEFFLTKAFLKFFCYVPSRKPKIFLPPAPCHDELPYFSTCVTITKIELFLWFMLNLRAQLSLAAALLEFLLFSRYCSDSACFVPNIHV